MSAVILSFPARRTVPAVVEPTPAIGAEAVRRIVNAALEACWYSREGLDLSLIAIDDVVTMAGHPGLDGQLAADAAEFLAIATGWLAEARDKAHFAALARDDGPLLASGGGELLR